MASGDMVSKGDPLIVLNSMKMETIISAQASGKIQMNIEAGIEITTGQLLATIAEK